MEDDARTWTDNSAAKIVENGIDQRNCIAVLVDDREKRRVAVFGQRHRHKILYPAMKLDPGSHLRRACVRNQRFGRQAADARVTDKAVAICESLRPSSAMT